MKTSKNFHFGLNFHKIVSIYKCNNLKQITMEENNKRIAEEIINFIKSNYKTLKEEKTLTVKVNDNFTLDYTIYPFEVAKIKNMSAKASLNKNDKKVLDMSALLYFRIMKHQQKWYDEYYGSFHEVNDKYFNYLYEKFMLSLNFAFKKK